MIKNFIIKLEIILINEKFFINKYLNILNNKCSNYSIHKNAINYRSIINYNC